MAAAFARRQMWARVSLLENELDETRRQLKRCSSQTEILNGFLLEYPALSRRLHSRGSPRELTQAVLEIVDGLFQPEQALFALHRRGAGEDGSSLELRVTGTLRDGLPKVGEAIRRDGLLGLVVESKTVMGPEDFDRLPRFQTAELRRQQGYAVDVAAPLLIDDGVAGLIAMRAASKRGSFARELLGAIAELAARSAFGAFTYNRMKRKAETDPLTATLNKASVLLSLSEEIVERLEQQDPVSVFLFDIDNFKNYNDVNGHLAGDRLLKELATLVVENVRLEDVFGRFGGEEFLLVLPFTESQGALVVAEKLRSMIANHSFQFRERQPHGRLTISGGVATFPDHGSSSTELVRMADEALYRAKDAGRNRVLVASTGGAS